MLAPNGKTSKLYQDALSLIKDKEQALRLWATGYTPSFNKWMSNLKPETTPQIKPGVEDLFNSNPELANEVYESLGFKTLENSNLEKDIKNLIKNRENIPSSIFLSFLIQNQLVPKIQEYVTSISHRAGQWNPLYNILTLNYTVIQTSSEKAKLISHELMHSLSHKYITAYEALKDKEFKNYIERTNKNEKIKGTNRQIEVANLTKKQIEAFDNLVRIKQKVFDFIKEGNYKSNDKLLKADFGSLNYAFSDIDKKEDIHEFISEAFSNPILIDVLKQIPSEGNKSSLFEDFIKALMNVLGFSNESIIEDILYYSEKAFIKNAIQESNKQKQQAQQLYSQYLDTIFPDSKVKDIVYHTNTRGRIESFNSERGLFVTPTWELAKTYKPGLNGKRFQLVIDSKNINQVSEETIMDGKKQSGDTLMYSEPEYTEYVVFDQKQIHELGSKQDIEGFKKFVGDESKSKQTEVKSSPVQKTVILNNGNYLNLSEEKKKEIYENYVNLMDRKREGKAVDISKFDLVFNNLQVFNYKDTYIFGEWDVENNIFRGRLMSSPGIKELYGALDELFKTVDFVASVPEDIGKMLEKKGLYKLEVGKNYNFRGEEMIKNLYLSDEKLIRKIFKKATNAVTEEDVKKYDTFYNQYSTQAKFIDNYIPYSIKKEQQQNIKKDVSASALSEILSILDKDKIDFKTLYYVQLLSQKFSEYIKEQPQYESREELFKKISKEVDNIFIKIRESAISNKKFNYFENKNKELINDIEGAIKDKLSIYIPKIQVDDQNFYENLKELGIYDYNAFRLARKIKSGKVTEEDKSSFIKEIVKNSSLNKITIDKTDIFNDPKIYSELDTELNKTLANYLSNFGITTEVLENFQDKFNTDSFATVDILNKIIYTSKNNQTDYPQQAGKLIAYMMQHNPLVTEVMKDLKKYSIYRSLSKDELLDTVGDLIAEQLYKKTNTDISKSLLDKLKMLIHQFFINLTTLKLNRINRNVGFIADNVLLQNQSLITSSIYKPGAQDKKTSQVNLEEALKNDKFGNDIVDKMADHFILTGSPSLSEQGSILRPIENHLHDLDWVSPYEKTKTEKLFNSLYPNNQFVREIKGENNDTKTWLIVPEGYKIINLEIIGDKNTVMGYDIVDENNNIVSSYDKKNDNHTGKIEAKLIDIFIYTNDKSRKEDSTGIPYILPSGKVLLLSDWRITFKAKLGYARLKDIWDYNRFVPYKSTSNLETFLDENGEPKLSTISSFLISNKKNSEPGVINNNSGVTFTTDNPLFNKCAQ